MEPLEFQRIKVLTQMAADEDGPRWLPLLPSQIEVFFPQLPVDTTGEGDIMYIDHAYQTELDWEFYDSYFLESCDKSLWDMTDEDIKYLDITALENYIIERCEEAAPDDVTSDEIFYANEDAKYAAFNWPDDCKG